MDSIKQLVEPGNPSSQESPLSLYLLLDTLAALSDETSALPSPLGLFASELEKGLTGFLGANDDR